MLAKSWLALSDEDFSIRQEFRIRVESTGSTQRLMFSISSPRFGLEDSYGGFLGSKLLGECFYP